MGWLGTAVTIGTALTVTFSMPAGVFFPVGPSPAAAATFRVDDFGEGQDGAHGDGVCATADLPPKCTLRAAAQETNVLPGADTIVLPAGKFLLNGCVIFRDTVIVRGAGAATTIIDAVGHDDVFEVNAPGETVSISGVTLFGGGGFGTTRGGGLFNQASALTTLTSCRLIGNAAGAGGAIYNAAGSAMRIEACEIRDNLSTSAALGAFGGGVANFGRLTIVDSAITHNSAIAEGAFAARGGGVYSSGGRLTIARSTISDNLVFSAAGAASGGGISADGTAEFLITDATIRDNAAKSATSDLALEVRGGGVFLSDVPSGTIKRTALSGNSVYSLLTAESARGGGIAVAHPTASSVITVQDQSSITDNRTNGTRNGGFYRQTPGSLVLGPGTVVQGNLPK